MRWVREHGVNALACVPAPMFRIARSTLILTGFMSCTTDFEQARMYALNSGGARIIYEVHQGLVNRGAEIAWLSQFPTEAECLFPPFVREPDLDLRPLSCHTDSGSALLRVAHPNLSFWQSALEVIYRTRPQQAGLGCHAASADKAAVEEEPSTRTHGGLLVVELRVSVPSDLVPLQKSEGQKEDLAVRLLRTRRMLNRHHRNHVVWVGSQHQNSEPRRLFRQRRESFDTWYLFAGDHATMWHKIDLARRWRASAQLGLAMDVWWGWHEREFDLQMAGEQPQLILGSALASGWRKWYGWLAQRRKLDERAMQMALAKRNFRMMAMAYRCIRTSGESRRLAGELTKKSQQLAEYHQLVEELHQTTEELNRYRAQLLVVSAQRQTALTEIGICESELREARMRIRPPQPASSKAAQKASDPRAIGGRRRQSRQRSKGGGQLFAF